MRQIAKVYKHFKGPYSSQKEIIMGCQHKKSEMESDTESGEVFKC